MWGRVNLIFWLILLLPVACVGMFVMINACVLLSLNALLFKWPLKNRVNKLGIYEFLLDLMTHAI